MIKEVYIVLKPFNFPMDVGIDPLKLLEIKFFFFFKKFEYFFFFLNEEIIKFQLYCNKSILIDYFNI